MVKLMQVDRWRLCQQGYDHMTYIILHYCANAPDRLKNFGADGRPLKQTYSWVVDLDGIDKCIGCRQEPPAELTGFVSMLEWER